MMYAIFRIRNIMQTTLMTQHIWEIHLPKPNPSCIVWSRQQTASDIDLHVNADKTEYMCFNKKKETSPHLMMVLWN